MFRVCHVMSVCHIGEQTVKVLDILPVLIGEDVTARITDSDDEPANKIREAECDTVTAERVAEIFREDGILASEDKSSVAQEPPHRRLWSRTPHHSPGGDPEVLGDDCHYQYVIVYCQNTEPSVPLAQLPVY